MIYMHVMDKTFSGVRSPLDRRRLPGGTRRGVADGEDDGDVKAERSKLHRRPAVPAIG